MKGEPVKIGVNQGMTLADGKLFTFYKYHWLIVNHQQSNDIIGQVNGWFNCYIIADGK